MIKLLAYKPQAELSIRGRAIVLTTRREDVLLSADAAINLLENECRFRRDKILQQSRAADNSDELFRNLLADIQSLNQLRKRIEEINDEGT